MEEDSNSDDLDDLANFQEDQQRQVVERVMRQIQGKGFEDDAEGLQILGRNKKVEQIRGLSQEQRLSRQLKLKNALKYFQVVRLSYLENVCESLKECRRMEDQYQLLLARYLSLLPLEILQKYRKMKGVNPFSLDIEELLKFLREVKEFLAKDISNWNDVFWAFCLGTGVACRKVHFYDLEGRVQQLFYKLRYGQNEKKRKKDAKKTKQQQLVRIQIDRILHSQSSQPQEYVDLDEFAYDQSISRSQSSKPEPQVLKAKRENNWIRKKTYLTHYFQLFSVIDKEWRLVNSEILDLEETDEFRKTALEGKAIIGFYGMRLLPWKNEYRPFAAVRFFGSVIMEDLTNYFCDIFAQVNSRRRRVGCKNIMRLIFRRASFWKAPQMLTDFGQFVQSASQQAMLQFHLANFPKDKQGMLNSEYFVVPSLLSQYTVLRAKAVPLSVTFQDEPVYLRRDMIGASSRNGWVDKHRKVKKGEEPVKKTENKSKNLTELFLFEQTEPFNLQLGQDGFPVPDDLYSSLYVPPEFQPPQGLALTPHKVGYVCNRAHIPHVQIVQGFTRNGGRILPNYIGYLIPKNRLEQVEALWQERQKKLAECKSKGRTKQLTALWLRLLKKIELLEWSDSFIV